MKTWSVLLGFILIIFLFSGCGFFFQSQQQEKPAAADKDQLPKGICGLNVGEVPPAGLSVSTEYKMHPVINSCSWFGEKGSLCATKSDQGFIVHLFFDVYCGSDEKICIEKLVRFGEELSKKFGTPTSRVRSSVTGHDGYKWVGRDRTLIVTAQHIEEGESSVCVFLRANDPTLPCNSGDGFNEFFQSAQTALHQRDWDSLYSCFRVPFKDVWHPGKKSFSFSNKKQFYAKRHLLLKGGGYNACCDMIWGDYKAYLAGVGPLIAKKVNGQWVFTVMGCSMGGDYCPSQ